MLVYSYNKNEVEVMLVWDGIYSLREKNIFIRVKMH